ETPEDATPGRTAPPPARPGAADRVPADLDRRAEDRPCAHAGAAPDRRALAQLVPPLRAAHKVVVRRLDAGGDEDVLLERRVRGDVRHRLDLRARADRRVVLAERATPADAVVAGLAALADAGLVADDHSRAEARSSEDDRARRDDGARSEHEWRQFLPPRGGARRKARLFADDRVVEDRAVVGD